MAKQHIISGIKVVGTWIAGIWGGVEMYRIARYYDCDSTAAIWSVIFTNAAAISFVTSRIMEKYTEGSEDGTELVGLVPAEEI